MAGEQQQQPVQYIPAASGHVVVIRDLPPGINSTHLFQLLQPNSPGLLLAHAVALGERSTSALLVFSTESAANNAVAIINGKYVQHDGLVLMNQKLSATRPTYFSNLATANPSVVWQELIHGHPLTPVNNHQQYTPNLRLLACDGPISRSPSPATLQQQASPPLPPPVQHSDAMGPTSRGRGKGRRNKRNTKHQRAAHGDDSDHGDVETAQATTLDGGVTHAQPLANAVNTVNAADMTQQPNQQASQENRAPHDTQGTLYVRGLPDQASNNTLHALFAQYGQLHSAHMHGNHGEPRYGFVTLHSREAAARAMQDLNGRPVLGCMMHVDWAKGPRARPPRGRSELMRGRGV